MTSGGAGASAQLAVADNMKMLPVLVLGLLKNVGLGFYLDFVVWRRC
jgi:protein transport protein SEC24